MKVQAGASKSKYPNILTKLQHWFFGINFSHNYIRFQISVNYESLDLVLHATSMGLHVVSYKAFCEKRMPVIEFEITCSIFQHGEFIRYAFDTTGKPYGTKQMIGAGLCKVFRLKKNPFGNVDETFCSKAIGNILEKFFGFDLPGDPNTWVPKDIIVYLLKKGVPHKRYLPLGSKM